MPMNQLPRNLTQGPKTDRDPLNVMLAAEDAQRVAMNNFETWKRTGSDVDYKLAELGFAQAQTLWAQAQFYGMPL